MAKRDRSQYPTTVSEPKLESDLGDVIEGIPGAPSSVTTINLETAAELLLSHAPENIQAIMGDIMQNSTQPLSSYFLSYLQRAYEQRALARPVGEYALPAKETDAAGMRPTPCAWCGKDFTPTLRGQKFCPAPVDDTEPCSVQAGMAPLRTARAQVKTPKELVSITPPSRVARRASALV